MTCRRRRPRWLIAVVALAFAGTLAVVDAGRATAAGDRPAPGAKRQAQNAMARGSALFRAGDYEGALRTFNEAQALYPSPKIFFNLGQTYRKLGDVAAAVEAFEKFLAQAPDAAPARRKDAERYLVELRPRLPPERAAAPVVASAPPENAAPSAAPPSSSPPPTPPESPAPIAVPPAPPAEPPPKPRLALEAPPPSALPQPVLDTGGAPQPERASSGRRWWPWVVGGAVVAGGVAAALLITREGSLPTGSLGNVDRRTR